MENIIAEMNEYFSDPDTDSFAISREEWQSLIKESQTTTVQQLKAKIGSIEQYAWEQLNLKKNPSDIVLAVISKLSQLSVV